MKAKLLKMFLITAVTLLLSITVCVFSSAGNGINGAGSDPDLKIRVGLFEAGDAYAEIQKLPGEEKNEYALFLPSDCNRKNLRVTFDYETVYIDSKPIVSGETTSVFAEDKAVIVKTDTGAYRVKIRSSENLPALFITTESGGLDAIHADKSHKEKASLTLVDGGQPVIESSTLTHIKGRGSLSWGYNDKRSYNIKFAEKTEILGMAAAKKWALISNNRDHTLMRNAIVYTGAKMTNLPYTVDFRFVDLYINGNYRGNYMICEKIEVGQNRININNLEKANKEANPGINFDDVECIQEDFNGMRLKYWKLPNDPDDVSGGYLLEYDREDVFGTESSALMARTGVCMQIRSPDHVSQKEIKYIALIYDEFEEALLSPDGKNSKGKSYMEYIDLDSFVDAAFINEFTLERDGGASSWYIFLPEGSNKFFAGPAWDFDVSMEWVKDAPDSVHIAAEKLVKSAEELEESTKDWEGNVLLQLLSKREFIDLVAERSQELCDVFKTELNGKAKEMFDVIAASAECDRFLWGYEIVDKTDAQLPKFVPKRAETLKKIFSDFDAAVEAEAKLLRESEPSAPVNERRTVKPIIIASVSAGAVVIAAVCILIVKKKKRGKKKINASGKKKK